MAGPVTAPMAFVPPTRHLVRAKDLADARYSEPLDVDDMAHAAAARRTHGETRGLSAPEEGRRPLQAAREIP